jgi:hypothetical protein
VYQSAFALFIRFRIGWGGGSARNHLRTHSAVEMASVWEYKEGVSLNNEKYYPASNFPCFEK